MRPIQTNVNNRYNTNTQMQLKQQYYKYTNTTINTQNTPENTITLKQYQNNIQETLNINKHNPTKPKMQTNKTKYTQHQSKPTTQQTLNQTIKLIQTT